MLQIILIKTPELRNSKENMTEQGQCLPLSFIPHETAFFGDKNLTIAICICSANGVPVT